MSRKYSKYQVPEQENQHEVLPNFLGYTRLEDLHKAEFAGFLKAQYILLEQLTTSTVFNAQYILNIHKLSLSHIYSFAGKLRTVNMSKGGFLFPSARFLPHAMHDFEQNILLPFHKNIPIRNRSSKISRRFTPSSFLYILSGKPMAE